VTSDVPAGFTRLNSKKPSPFVVKTETPFYGRLDANRAEFAFKVEEHHMNSLGFCHGGMLMTFLDVSTSIMASLPFAGKRVGLTQTISNVSFVRPIKAGPWLICRGAADEAPYASENKRLVIPVSAKILDESRKREYVTATAVFSLPAEDMPGVDMLELFNPPTEY